MWRGFFATHTSSFARRVAGACVFGFDSGSCRMWKIDKIVVNARNSFPADGTQNFTAAPHPPRRNPFVPLGAVFSKLGWRCWKPRTPPAISRLMESRHSHSFFITFLRPSRGFKRQSMGKRESRAPEVFLFPSNSLRNAR